MQKVISLKFYFHSSNMININYFMADHITNYILPFARYVLLKWLHTTRAAARQRLANHIKYISALLNFKLNLNRFNSNEAKYSSALYWKFINYIYS